MLMGCMFTLSLWLVLQQQFDHIFLSLRLFVLLLIVSPFVCALETVGILYNNNKNKQTRKGWSQYV